MFFGTPPTIETEVWARVPDELSLAGRESAWLAKQRRGEPLGSFLEGPSFDRDGNLWLVDVAHGRIFRVSPDGSDWQVVVQYRGEPNGLKIHRDGRVFVADYANGIMELDPVSGVIRPFLGRERFPGFLGFNDLFFARNGDLWFTDQGYTGLHDPRGRVWRWQASDGSLHCLLDTVPSPNGLVMSPDESLLYVAVTRGNCVWRVPFLPDGAPMKVGLFVQLSGSLAGPDGMAVDREGNLFVVQHGGTRVFMFSPLGEPLALIASCLTHGMTNLAFGGRDNRDLYITESFSGAVLRARLEHPGEPMYAHASDDGKDGESRA